MRPSANPQPSPVLQASVDTFNKHWPVGTAVDVVKDLGEIVTTKTCGPAVLLGGHTPVVAVEGISGGYLLTRVTPRSSGASSPAIPFTIGADDYTYDEAAQQLTCRRCGKVLPGQVLPKVDPQTCHVLMAEHDAECPGSTRGEPAVPLAMFDRLSKVKATLAAAGGLDASNPEVRAALLELVDAMQDLINVINRREE